MRRRSSYSPPRSCTPAGSRQSLQSRVVSERTSAGCGRNWKRRGVIGLGRRYSPDPLADLVTGSAEVEEEELRERPELRLTDERLEALDRWSKDPWAFLTGTDPTTNEPIIRTQDQKDKAHPVKAFPSHLAYLHYLVEVIENEQ